MAEAYRRQEAQVQHNAAEVEKLLLAGNTSGAEETFRQHYIDTMNRMSPADAGTALASERAQLKSIDPTGYNLLIIDSAKHNPIIADEHITKKDLSLMSRLSGQPTAQDRFDADNAKDLLPQYDNLTGGVTHNVWNKFNPFNWQSGFKTSDLNRVGAELQIDERKRGMAAFAADTFLRNNGELMDKVAGVAGEIDRGTLQLALDKDNGTRLFTPEQRTSVQWMHDNWDDPAVNQLKNGKWNWGDYGKLLPWGNFDNTTAAAKLGWQNGNSWGGPVAGALEGAAAGLVGLVAGDAVLGADGSLTKKSLQDAYSANFGGNSGAFTALNEGSTSSVLPPFHVTTDDAGSAAGMPTPYSRQNDSGNSDRQLADSSAQGDYRYPSRGDDNIQRPRDYDARNDAGNADRAEDHISQALVHRRSGTHHVDADAGAIRNALTVHKHDSYSHAAERLLKAVGQHPSRKDIRRVAHELYTANGRRSPRHLKSGHVLTLNDDVLSDHALAALRNHDA